MNIACVLFTINSFKYISGAVQIAGYKAGTLANAGLVDILKQDLRRNNDDYLESPVKLTIIANTNATNANNIIDKATTSDSQFHNSSDTRRKGSIELELEHALSIEIKQPNNSIDELTLDDNFKSEKEFTTEAQVYYLHQLVSSTKHLNKPTPNYSPTHKHKLHPPKYNLSSKPQFLRINNKINQNLKTLHSNMQKFKSFMLKNKELYKNVLDHKQIPLKQSSITKNKLTTNIKTSNTRSTIRTSNWITFRANVSNTQKLATRGTSSRSTKVNLRNNPNKKVMRTDSPIHVQLPDAEILDMAPARGGRMNAKRMKGRLCDRQVLFPEGPKYDSKGRWYMPPHVLIQSRPFEQTTPAKILLPRCCNCCKKSVLGCE